MTSDSSRARVLIAFDKFKNALAAPQACAATAEVLARVRPEWRVEQCPMADGGEGFGPILTRSAGGRWVEREVTGPCGECVHAGFGLVRKRDVPAAACAKLAGVETLADEALIAIVEMATASGLAQVPMEARDPWTTRSTGTGELIAAAAAAGARAILLGVGGSATSDLGLPVLATLGIRGVDTEGREVAWLTPEHWERVARFEGAVRAGLPPVFIACDVANPLLGANGAAAVYGPQKGLRKEDVGRFDAEASRVARLLCAHCGREEALTEFPGAGAAGGIAFGLVCAAGARLVAGAELVGAWVDLDARLARADVVVTGEGRFDGSSLQGKGPGVLALRAAELGKRVVVLAGAVDAEAARGMAAKGVEVHAITPPGVPLREALTRAEAFLRAKVDEVFAAWP